MEGFYPINTSVDSPVQTDVEDVSAALVRQVRFDLSTSQAVAASVAGVHAAITDNGTTQHITTAFTNPPCPRNLTITAGGTAADVKAISVTFTGTDYNDEAISETIGPFTVNTTGTIQGTKAFKTVDPDFSLPAHDGTGATTSVGWGDKIGLPFKLPRNTVTQAHLGNTRESALPTVTVSSTVLASNTALLGSALNGTAVQLYFLVP